MNKLKRISAIVLSLIITISSTGCTLANKSNSSNTSQSNEASAVTEYAEKIFNQDLLKIEITTTEDDWANLMENATSKPWISGNITINGEGYENVGIKTKGNTSLTQISQTDSDRYSLKVKFGKYVDGQTCYGLDSLVLNNVYADNTYLKEYMSYDLFNYMDVPSSLCTFAEITVNGEHYGFYIALEDIEDRFIERNYGEDNSVEAYKPESMDMNGDMGDMKFDGFGDGGFNITQFITLTDKDGNSVEWTDITGNFDTQNIESITLSDGTVTKIDDIDMRFMQSFDISKVTAITDSNGNTLDLSDYTLSISMWQGFRGGMQMPDNSDGDTWEMPQMPSGEISIPNNSDGNIPEMPQLPDGEMFMPDNESDMQMPAGGGRMMGMNGGNNGVSLVYTDDEVKSYSNIFDENITDVDEEAQNRLIASLKGISEGEELEKYIEVDEVLRYTACNVFIMNLDSYFSSMGHNYVLTENEGALSMVPWDYNLAFGTYQSANSSDIINFAIDTVFSGVDAADRPIIGKLLENPEYLEKYHEYLREIAENYVGSGIFEETINKATSIIDEYVKNDSTSFNGYDAFKEGVEELKKYGSLRAKSIIGQLYGTIPSTTEAQKDSDALIDASSIDLTKLGTMNMGGMGGDRQMPDMKNFDFFQTPEQTEITE